MGGRGRSRTQRKHFHQSRENVWKRPKSDGSTVGTSDDVKRDNPWEPFTAENPGFDEYYKEQEIVPSEEWDVFIQYLRKPLPAAFRINSSQFYIDIKSQLENDFMKSLRAEDFNGCEVEAIKPIPWYPDNLAWQSNFSRNQLRKNQILERFHEFLKLENEIGNITRQEAVSMVPPLFLDIRPHHFVLDMCAAPGSKTFQLLEVIYKLTEPGNLPRGMVIANDLDVQRCNLLIHQTKRMCTANLIVTNHEAQHFPSCHFKKNNSVDSEVGIVKEISISQLQFDRVLCDVPCSGDGTLRKAPDIWRKWNAGMGNGLHGLQVQIAMRGVALLKVGGRMVYSTCSMNPVENEAVVAEVLRRCGGSIELVDVSNEIPELIRMPGLKKWKVRDKGLWLASYKDVPENRRSVVTPGMFPSGNSVVTSEHDETSELLSKNGDENSVNAVECMDDTVAPTNNLEAEVSTLPLERCMRIVPHYQNSGAFFVAVFHKLSSLPSTQKPSENCPRMAHSCSTEAENLINEVKDDSNLEDTNLINGTDSQISDSALNCNVLGTKYSKRYLENQRVDTEPSSNGETGAKTTAGKRKLQIQGRWRGVDPVIFFRDDSTIGSIMEFYGIQESFPFEGRLITRNNDSNRVKRIYYISNSVKEILELNLLSGQQLKIASVGIKMFERQTSKDGIAAPCLFRISSEGLPLIFPYLTKQILHASAVDFKHLLQYKSIKFSDFVDPEFGKKASNLLLGCCVVVLNKDGRIASNGCEEKENPVAIGCWRGRTNVTVMLAALDCQELLERMSILFSTNETRSGAEPVMPEVGSSNLKAGVEANNDSSDARQDIENYDQN
ncbi:tRNA (cytosine(34)-C(5))-methyltransferase [Dorcoceras hygrometricum]|nr:tRNA (cytosine(34)-C(5))-methyltransferase [Dorcoceras hygrometricum]